MEEIAEYEGIVLGDGHLSLPEEIRHRLNLWPQTVLQVKISKEDSQKENVNKAWNVLASMGRYAGEGKLDTASEYHDHYLYRKNRE